MVAGPAGAEVVGSRGLGGVLMSTDTWNSWVRPLVLAFLPAAAAALIAWGTIQSEVGNIREDVARIERHVTVLEREQRGLGNDVSARLAGQLVLETSLDAIKHQLARIERRLETNAR